MDRRDFFRGWVAGIAIYALPLPKSLGSGDEWGAEGTMEDWEDQSVLIDQLREIADKWDEADVPEQGREIWMTEETYLRMREEIIAPWKLWSQPTQSETE